MNVNVNIDIRHCLTIESEKPKTEGPMWAVLRQGRTASATIVPEPLQAVYLAARRPNRDYLKHLRKRCGYAGRYDFRDKIWYRGVYASMGRPLKVYNADPELGTPGKGFGFYTTSPDQEGVENVYYHYTEMRLSAAQVQEIHFITRSTSSSPALS